MKSSEEKTDERLEESQTLQPVLERKIGYLSETNFYVTVVIVKNINI